MLVDLFGGGPHWGAEILKHNSGSYKDVIFSFYRNQTSPD